MSGWLLCTQHTACSQERRLLTRCSQYGTPQEMGSGWVGNLLHQAHSLPRRCPNRRTRHRRPASVTTVERCAFWRPSRVQTSRFSQKPSTHYPVVDRKCCHTKALFCQHVKGSVLCALCLQTANMVALQAPPFPPSRPARPTRRHSNRGVIFSSIRRSASAWVSLNSKKAALSARTDAAAAAAAAQPTVAPTQVPAWKAL